MHEAPKPLTYEEAVTLGFIQHSRKFTHEGVSVLDYERREHLFFENWSQFRLWKREDYLADKLELTPKQRQKLRVQFRDVEPGVHRAADGEAHRGLI